MRLGEPEIPTHFGARDNIGVLLGEASGLADVDLDSKEAIALADKFVPSGAEHSHRIYKVSGQVPPFRAHRDYAYLRQVRERFQQSVTPAARSAFEQQARAS
jgi:hypothetical protein